MKDKYAYSSNGAADNRPDIYHIVLDGYARGDVLKDHYQYNNDSFDEAMKELGFIVKDNYHANYINTPLALTSTQTFNYLDSSKLDKNLSRDLLITNTQQNGLKSLFTHYGYQYIEVTSPLSTDANSDVMSIYHNPGLIVRYIIGQTALKFVYGRSDSSNDYVLWRQKLLSQIDTLKSTHSTDKPIFIYCHLLLPHPPFVFKSGGEPNDPNRPFSINDCSEFLKSGGTIDEYRYGYIEQLIFTNKKIIETIKAIENQNARPKLIMISSDHGPRIRINQEKMDNSGFSEAYPIYFAYHLPEGDNGPPFDTIHTPVNLYRIIANYYFNTQYPLLSDRCFFSSWDRPLMFTEIRDEFD